MSRIGNLPVELPEKVVFSIDENNFALVKGPLGELSQQIDPRISVKIEDNQVSFSRNSEDNQIKSLHGL